MQQNVNESFDSMPNRQTTLVDFWQIIRVIQRWWWLIGLIIAVITTIVSLLTFRLTPIYQASSLIQVKQEERKIVDVSEVENIIVDKEFLSTQVELLKSERLIENTIESLNLMQDLFLIPDYDQEWETLPRDLRLRGLVSRFKEHLSVGPVGRTRLIKVKFEHSNPQKAAKITNTMTENFIADGISRKFETTEFAREFLENQLKTVRSSLEDAERNLVSYANDNGIILADGENSTESSGSLDKTALKALNEQLTQASVERVEAEIVYQQSLQNPFSEEVLTNSSLAKLKEQQLELTSEYQEQLAIFKPAYPKMLELKSRIQMFDEEISKQEQSITSFASNESENAYNLAVSKEEDLAKRVNSLRSAVINTREKTIGYNILKRQVETERTQYEALLQRLKEVSISYDFGSNLVEIVDKASTPLKPFKPNNFRNILLSLIFSGALGFSIAYAVEVIDDRIKTPQDIKLKLQQITMGVIPWVKDQDELLNLLKDSQSGISEAYSSLRTNIQYSGDNGGPRIIQITSTRAGEGKSVSALGTAIRFAGTGHRVILIDADMRRPTFTLNPSTKSIGLSGVLTQNVDFSSVVLSTLTEKLDLIPSGTIVPNPSELLANKRFDNLLSWARDNYDYVIVDSPPVLGLADAPIIGAKVNATILVVDAGVLRTPNIKGSIERLKNSGTKLLGVIMTKYRAQAKGYTNYYQYTYGQKATSYGNDSSKGGKNPKGKRKFNIT